MDLAQARTLLQRINRVFDDFGEGDSAPSALEADLLKEYVRRFYESLGDETAANYRNGGRPKSGNAVITETPPTSREKTRRPLSGRRLREDSPPRPQAQSVPKPPAPKPPPKPAPAILQIPDSVEEDIRNAQAQAATPPPSEAPTSPPSAAPPSPPSEAPPQTEGRPTSAAPFFPLALRELFTREHTTDLGDRLGNAPVADLTRAMGLNQRLVVQNQLFNKDADALRDTLTEVNNQDSYEDAARALVAPAREYDWNDDERRGVARDFIKLVQRRYPT